MDTAFVAPRSKRIKPGVVDDLAALRLQLATWVQLRLLSADQAFARYMERLAVVVRDPSCHIDDDRSWSPVKCRKCGHTTQVPDGVDFYACLCSPTQRRAAYLDMVAVDGRYMVEPDKLPELGVVTRPGDQLEVWIPR